MNRKSTGNEPEMDRKWTGTKSEMHRKWIGNKSEMERKWIGNKPEMNFRILKKSVYLFSNMSKQFTKQNERFFVHTNFGQISY